jgi:hypothetical protein
MPSSAGDWDMLRQKAARQRDALLSKAVSMDGRLEASDLRDLVDLTSLLESRTGKSSRSGPSKIVLAIVFVAIGATMTLLLSKLPRTSVEMDVRASSLNFSTRSERTLAEGVTPTALSVSGLESVFIPSQGADPRRHIATSAVQLWQPAPAKQDGPLRRAITLDLPRVASGTTLRIEREDDSGEYQLSACVEREPIAVAVADGVRLSIPGHTDLDLHGADRRRVLLLPAARNGGDACARGTAIGMRFALDPSDAVQLAPDLELDRLSFLRRAVSRSGADGSRQLVSSIISGTIYLTDLGGRSRPLRRNERLLLDDFQGVAPSIRIEATAVAVLAEGRVKGITSGPRENARSLMPSILEWWTTRESLFLVWTTTVSLFGVLLALLKFLSRER